MTKIKQLWSKIISTLTRDLKYDEIYTKVVGVTFLVAIIAVFTAETYPIPSVVVAALAGAFSMACYFLRHSHK